MIIKTLFFFLLFTPVSFASPSENIKECYEKYGTTAIAEYNAKKQDWDVYTKKIHGQDVVTECIIQELDKMEKKNEA